MSSRRWVLPTVLATALALFLVLTPITWWTVPPASGRTEWVTIVSLVVAARISLVAAVLVARARPWLALALAVWPLGLVLVLGWFDWGMWLALVMVAVVMAVDGRARALVPLAAAFGLAGVYCFTELPAMLPIGPVTSGTGREPELIVMGLYAATSAAAVATAWAVGAAGRSRRRSAQAAAESRHALEVESVASERARIARDLHDVVAHHISLVAVRAESAPYTHPGLGDDARRVLADIATDARGALAELRQVLVVLQRTDEGAARAPQPGAGDVATLVEQARSAGHDVRFTRTGAAVPPTAGYVLYRAAQEALTNARRHAPGAAVTLALSADDDVARLRCVNDAPAGAVVPGRGLLGMRERVEAVGGTLGVVAEGGSVAVDVVVPVRCPDEGAASAVVGVVGRSGGAA